LKSDLERIDRTIRDNDSRNFNSAEERGRALRVELSEATSRSTTTLVTSLAAVGEAQKAQLENFATVLASSTRAVDDRLVGISEQQHRTLTDFAQANTEGAKALRDEIGAALKAVGEDLRANAGAAAETQKEHLRDVSTNIVELNEGIGQRFESFRQLTEARSAEMRLDAGTAAKQLREEVTNTLNRVGEDLRENAKRVGEEQRISIDSMSNRMREIGETSQHSQEKLRESVAEGLTTLRYENEQKLEQMQTVDEKLQSTLERRLGESFSLVTEQLKQVHEGLGDMQRLAPASEICSAC
jgi:DNA anti-recombination protein RmuC